MDSHSGSVCLIVVTYSRVATLQETLKSLSRQECRAKYVVIVNNGSNDSTLKFLSDYQELRLEVLNLNVNLGFGYGLSAGMKFSMSKWNDFDFFMLMDDDTQPDSEYINHMMEARARLNKIGILSTTGFVDHVWKGPVNILNYLRKDMMLLCKDSLIYQVDHVLIDGALIDRSVVEKVGTLREDIFMMCEDAEYSKRIKWAGYSVAVLEDNQKLKRLHLGGGDRFSFSTRWRGYYHSRNHLMILKEYFSWKGLLIYLIRQTKYLLAALQATDRVDRIRLRLLGIYHGLIGKMGKTIDPELYKPR